MKSALQARLNDELTRKLVEHCCDRIRAMTNAREGQDWQKRRERYEKMADGDYSFRPTRHDDPRKRNIFDLSNETTHPVRGIVRFIHARVCKELFGSKPWFAATPRGAMDAELASQVQPHADYKLTQACYVEKIREAIQGALDLGECPIQTTWRVEEDVYERLALVLVDKKTGEPVLTADGDYIYDTDELMEREEAAPLDGTVPVEPPLEEEAEAAAMVFTKAPDVVMHAGLEFREHLVEERNRIYAGLEIVPMNWRDVLWPINAPDMESADCVVLRTDVPLKTLMARFAGPPEEWDEKTRALETELKTMGESEPQSEDAKPKPGEGASRATDIENPVIKLTECYLNYDVFGDGRPRRLYVALVEKCEKVVWADYLATMSPRGRKPVHLVTVGKVKGRAYGRGLYQVYEDLQQAMERLLNGVLYRNHQNSDPVKIWNPHNTKEGEMDANLVLAPGSTLTAARAGVTAKDILDLVNIPNLDGFTWQVMQTFQQVIQVESGVTNASQGNLSELPSNSTASGVNSMLESSSVLHQLIMEEIRSGLKQQLGYAVELLYFMQDVDETYEFLEGRAEAVMALQSAVELAKFPIDIEITLTRARNQSMREAGLAAIPQVVSFFQLMRSDPEAAARIQPLFVQVLKALEISDADKLLPSPEEIIQAAQAMADQAAKAAAQGAPPSDEAGATPAGAPPLPSNVTA